MEIFSIFYFIMEDVTVVSDASRQGFAWKQNKVIC